LSAAVPAPEPSSLALFAFGAVGVLFLCRRRHMQGHG
jgi:hypothetical protein